LGLALQTFTGIDFMQVLKGLGVLVLFTVGIMALGMLLTSGIGAVLFGAGIIGMLAMGAALIVLGVGFMAVGKGMEMIGGGLSVVVGQIGNLVAVSSGILSLAGVFTTLSLSIMQLAGSLLMITPMLPTLMLLSAIGALTSGGLLGGEGSGDGTSAGGGEDGLGAKLDIVNSNLQTLIGLYQEGGIVNLDGRKVGDIIGNKGIMRPSIA
jgi:hypothetical protein